MYERVRVNERDRERMRERETYIERQIDTDTRTGKATVWGRLGHVQIDEETYTMSIYPRYTCQYELMEHPLRAPVAQGLVPQDKEREREREIERDIEIYNEI